MNNKIDNKLNIRNRVELRNWLINNIEKESEFYVIVKKGKLDYNISILPYLDAVEEALCFGFIDTTTHKTKEGLLQKFIKRKQNGRWSELNKERVRRLKGDAVSKEASETTNNQTYWYAIIADTLKEERYVNNG